MNAYEIELANGVWDKAMAAKEAVRYVDHPDNYQAVYGMSRYAVRALIAAAFQAGRESAYTRDEWRANNGALMWGHSEIRAQTEDFLDASRDAWLEHRRTGATEWQRVDQAGERQQSEAAADA